MSIEALKIIADAMSEMGLHYDFMEWTSAPVYPYFTGEYQEVEALNEDGMQETAFILNGFSRDDEENGISAYLSLENAKEKIRSYFPNVGGKVVITATGAAVAIFYANSLNIPTGDAELKRLQINLTIKEWSVK